MLRHLLLMVGISCALLFGSPALAGSDKDAELQRLREEMMDLAARNAWKGVDRMYGKMLDGELAPRANDHLMGAQASTNLGQMLQAVERLERALANAPEVADDQQTARDTAKLQLDDILNRYGKVEIEVGNGRLPGLIRFELPFGTEERETIQRAREAILKDRTYRGLLPVGGYMIDGEKFEVASSGEWQTVKVG